MNKQYIGDSVYAEFNEAGQLVLTTENGFGPSNTVIVEEFVWQALEQYVDAFWEGR